MKKTVVLFAVMFGILEMFYIPLAFGIEDFSLTPEEREAEIERRIQKADEEARKEREILENAPTREEEKRAQSQIDEMRKKTGLESGAKLREGQDSVQKAKQQQLEQMKNFYSGKLKPTDAEGKSPLFSLKGVTGTLLPNLATWITGFLAAISVLFLMYAGYEYMTAGGEEEKLTHARNTALYTILGVILMMFAYALVYLFLTLFTP